MDEHPISTQLSIALSRIQHAHSILDDWEVPTMRGGDKLTVLGRLEWLSYEHPEIVQLIKEAARADKSKEQC